MLIFSMLLLNNIAMITIKDLFTEICKRGCTIETRSKYPTDYLPKCLVKVNDNIIDPVYSNIPAVFYDNKNFDRSYFVNVAFKISSIIPGSVHIYFVKQKRQKCEGYCGLRLGKMEKQFTTYKAIMCVDGYTNMFYIDKDIYIRKPYHEFDKGNNIEQFNYLTNILYSDTQILRKKFPSNQLNIITYDLDSDEYIYTNGKYDRVYLQKNVKIKMIHNLINEGILEYIRLFHKFFLPKEIKLLIINVFMKMDNWNNLGICIDFCSN